MANLFNGASHCECCGQENPKSNEGYTTCCNELICYGDDDITFISHDSKESVTACCWAKAEIEWEKKYGHPAPNGSYHA